MPGSDYNYIGYILRCALLHRPRAAGPEVPDSCK